MGQTTIFTESMGIVSSTTTIATHEANNGFDNDSYTMTQGGATNPADIRATSQSSGYTGASGSANVWFTSINASYGFAIEGIDASSYSSLKVQFGYRKESSSALPTLALDYWNGSSYVNVPYTFNEAANASTGWYLSPQIALPSGAEISNLRLRWVKSGTIAVRIDDVKLTGTAASIPTITVGSISSFGNQTINTASSEQSYSVSGSNLTDNIIITPPVGFEISLTSGSGFISNPSTITLYHSGGSVSSTPIFVRFLPTTSGSYSGNITHASSGATTQNVAVAGTGVCLSANLPFIEDFDYSTSSLITTHCWNAHSASGTNPITVTSASISYPGYLSSGIGNEISLTTSGEDDSRSFTAQTSGVLYASFLVNVTSATTGGDYFFHFGPSVIGSTFRARVAVKKDASDNLFFGIAHTSTPIYTTTAYSLNTTYLIVVKYSFVDGSANDVAAIYINPPLNQYEPSSGWLVNTDTPTDPTDIGTVALRQGTASSAPALILDGIRVSTDYTDIAGAVPPPLTATWTGLASNNQWKNHLNWDNGIPGAITDVNIPAGLSYYPTLSVAGSCNNIVLESSASGTATLIDNGYLTVNGTATVQRYFSGNDIDWHLVSSPISGATANVFLNMYLQSFSEATNIFTDVIDPSTSLLPMEGYALYSTLASTNTAAYTGTLNFGYQSRSFSASNAGWNLMGNPFVSSIDWETVSIPVGMSNEVHYIDAVTGNDLSYVKGVGGTGSQYIPPMQGFFISATGSGTFSLDDAQRTHSGSGNFYKSDNTKLVILEASNGSYADQTWIHFNYQADMEHDGVYDAYKRISSANPSLPQIYSITPLGSKLSINGMPEITTVPVGFTAQESGLYTITVQEINDIAIVLLEDLINGQVTDLKTSSYSFSYNKGDNEGRFIVHFAPLSINDPVSGNINVFSDQNKINVIVPENTQGKIYISTILGQQVFTGQILDTKTTIPVSESGYYLVKVMTNTSVVTKKVFVR